MFKCLNLGHNIIYNSLGNLILKVKIFWAKYFKEIFRCSASVIAWRRKAPGSTIFQLLEYPTHSRLVVITDLPTLTVSPWDSRFGVSTHGLTIWPPNLTVNQEILKLPNNSGSMKQYWKTVLKMAKFVTSNVWGKAGYNSDLIPVKP